MNFLPEAQQPDLELPEPPTLRSLSSAQQEKEGQQNLANRAISILQQRIGDDDIEPHSTLVELFQIFEFKEYEFDQFRASNWPKIFRLMSQKVAQVNDLIEKLRQERDLQVQADTVRELDASEQMKEINRMRKEIQALKQDNEDLIRRNADLTSADSNDAESKVEHHQKQMRELQADYIAKIKQTELALKDLT